MNASQFKKKFGRPTVTLDKCPVLAIGNHKGGVGKSWVSCWFAAVAAYAGFRVLLVDLCPQRNATDRLVDSREHFDKKYLDVLDLIIDPAVNVPDVIVGSKIENLFLIPSARDIDDRFNAVAFTRFSTPVLSLKKKLDPYRQHVDLIIIDTAPNLGLLNKTAFGAASHYMYVHDGSRDSDSGVMGTEEALNATIKDVNAELRCLGVLWNNIHTQSKTMKIAEQTNEIIDLFYFPKVIPARQNAKNSTWDEPDEAFHLRNIFTSDTRLKDIEDAVYENALHAFVSMGLLIDKSQNKAEGKVKKLDGGNFK